MTAFRATFAAACAAMARIVFACGGTAIVTSDVAAVDAAFSPACNDSRECPSEHICVFAKALGCSAVGRCIPDPDPQPFYQPPTELCGCDGGTSGLYKATDYALAPVGTCDRDSEAPLPDCGGRNVPGGPCGPDHACCRSACIAGRCCVGLTGRCLADQECCDGVCAVTGPGDIARCVGRPRDAGEP